MRTGQARGAARLWPGEAAVQLIEDAKKGGKITQVVVTLTSQVHGSLREYARSEDTNMDDAASMLIQDSLSRKGYLEGS